MFFPFVSFQLKPQTDISRSSSRVASESEEEAVDPSPIQASQAQASTSSAEGTSVQQPKGKGKGKTSQISRQYTVSDEDEGAALITMLRQQRDEAAKAQGEIAVLLDKDKATAMEHFGTFLGKLGTQIDDRLVPEYYRQALDLSLRMIERSRSLPPVDGQIHQPQQPPQQYQPYMVYQEQPRQQQQLTQDSGTTFTALVGPAPGSSEQAATSCDVATSSTWETFGPTAGMSLVNTVGQPSRPLSTPNMSLGSFPRLSDMSQTLLTTPPDLPDQ